MLKRGIAIFLLLIMVGGMLLACGSKKSAGITSDEAVSIALADMKISRADASSVHVHEGIHSNLVCYNVYVTVGDASKTYVISKLDGSILSIQDGAGHSH